MLVQIRQRLLSPNWPRLVDLSRRPIGSCILVLIRQRLLSPTKVTHNLLYASKLYQD